MKVIAFNGSPRKDGNTSIMIQQVFQELEAEGIETELISLAGKPLRGCIACFQCFEKKNGRCAATLGMADRAGASNLQRSTAVHGVLGSVLASPEPGAEAAPLQSSVGEKAPPPPVFVLRS